MKPFATYLRNRATSRAVLAAFALVFGFIAVFQFYLVPSYQAATGGFIPFDMQFPLSATSIAIQIGAFGRGTVAAYFRFAVADTFFPPAAAVATMLLWAWLINRARVRKLSQWFDEGLWIAALFPMICDLGENVLFAWIVSSGQTLPDVIDLAVQVHRAKSVTLSLNTAITVALVVGVLLGWATRRRGAVEGNQHDGAQLS